MKVDFHYRRDVLSRWMNNNVKHRSCVCNLNSGYSGIDDDDNDDEDN